MLDFSVVKSVHCKLTYANKQNILRVVTNMEDSSDAETEL